MVSETPDSNTRPRPDSADSPYLCGIREGDRRDSNPRPSEPQSADTCFWAFPDVAQSPYLSPFPYWWLPAVSACCALSGVRSGVNYLYCGRLVFAPQGTPDCAGWLLAKAYTRNVSLRCLCTQASPPLPTGIELDSRTREIVAGAMDEHHARLLNLLSFARLKVLSCHLRHLLGALPARLCDGPGLRKRGSRRPCSGSGKDPSPVVFAYSPAWSPDPAPPSLSSAEGRYPGR